MRGTNKWIGWRNARGWRHQGGKGSKCYTEERTLGGNPLCANNSVSELPCLLYGSTGLRNLICHFLILTASTNQLPIFLDSLMFREFGNWSKPTDPLKADPGFKPGCIWFWRPTILSPSIPLSKFFRYDFWIGDLDWLSHTCKSYWRSNSLLKLIEPHQFSQLFLVSIIFAILCGPQSKNSLPLPNALCCPINEGNLQFIALVSLGYSYIRNV